MPTSTTQNDKVFFKECAIAGWNFHDLEDNWEELHEGVKLALIRERNNKYDANAIAVALEDDYDEENADDFDFKFILGYVPRTENELMARMMDMGWNETFTAEISTVKRYGAYADRLRMSIYIQRKKEPEDKSADNMFAAQLDDQTYEKFTQELLTQGFSYFRWGGFPIWKRELPKQGNKVVFIHNRKEGSELYLMHVIAANEEKAALFIPNKNELDLPDDCYPFILTNIKGPILVSQDKLYFLKGESIDDYQSEHPLSTEATDKILELFT